MLCQSAVLLACAALRAMAIPTSEANLSSDATQVSPGSGISLNLESSELVLPQDNINVTLAAPVRRLTYDMNLLRQTKYVNQKKEEIDGSILSRYVALYFGTTYCKPCQDFQHNLIGAYDELKDSGLEVVWVAMPGEEQADFDKAVTSMPWLSTSLNDQLRIQLVEDFDITAVPVMVLLDSEGTQLTRNGVKHVLNDPLGFTFPWTD